MSRKNDLVFRFSIVSGLTLLAVATLTLMVNGYMERQSLTAALTEQASYTADLLAFNVSSALMFSNQDDIKTTVTAFGSDTSIRFIEIKDASGKVAGSFGNHNQESSTVIVTRPIRQQKDNLGSVTVALSTASVDEALGRERWNIILREAMGLILLFVVATVFMRREIFTPLASVADRLNDIADGDGDLTKRIDYVADNQIGAVARARQLCEKLLSYASPLLLYAEEIDPRTGRHLGNFPQAFTHLALINAVMHVIRADQHLELSEFSLDRELERGRGPD